MWYVDRVYMSVSMELFLCLLIRAVNCWSFSSISWNHTKICFDRADIFMGQSTVFMFCTETVLSIGTGTAEHLHCLISLRSALNGKLRTQGRLIRLGRCPGWSESLLATQIILLVLSCCGSLIILHLFFFSIAWCFFILSYSIPFVSQQDNEIKYKSKFF